MKKILFYTNNIDDVSKVISVYDDVVKDGFEVALGTHNDHLAYVASVGKLLTVNPSTYYSDFVVYFRKPPVFSNGELLSYEQFLVALK